MPKEKLKVRLKEVRKNLKLHLQLYINLYRDKRTPLVSKILLWVAVGYTLLPFDLIPDFIPVIGYFDDALVVPLLILGALKFVPKGLYQEHYARLKQLHK